ncbi:GL20742 [Drosophila persimilis]|uniref:GL20742 n=1 Tax=Drosophila persimilis TaxID=7234 RepID=B4H436_DROPE|nr:GL20742 [Drosophila persimilis]
MLRTQLMATGIVCAVLGGTDSEGFFNVEDYWPNGSLGNGRDSKSLVRLIIAGNSVRGSAVAHVLTLQLDSWFASWAQCLPIDVMPGAYDPVNFMLPQQPFHKCMFPQAAQLTSFQAVTYNCRLDDALIVGTAGQNVADLLRITSMESSLEALRCTLTWGHVAPTSPDTLACYPYIERDPFIMRECPHVCFAGNCESLETALHVTSERKRTCLVCVPSFGKTKRVSPW